jgi:hypothetical protein
VTTVSITLMMEAVRASETSANLNVITRRYIPEDSKRHVSFSLHLRLRRRPKRVSCRQGQSCSVILQLCVPLTLSTSSPLVTFPLPCCLLCGIESSEDIIAPLRA